MAASGAVGATPTRYTTVIGLEVHAQLLTRSKMFCGCRADYAAEPPNTLVCPVCLGLPGALPTINQRAVEYTALTGLALHCEVPALTRFDRKNYFYPDMMKNYQISQYDLPIARGGWLEVEVGGETRRIGVRRVHLEEDTAKLLHRSDAAGRPCSLVDVNRSGVPLMEIVSEPEIRSPEEARAYLVKLRTILVYLGVSTGSMEEGSFRCDANVSVMPVGSRQLGAKVEVKNMNSFRAVHRALEHEVERQVRELDAGGRVVQETRGWDDDRGVTVSQRSKEQAHDYRYFPEPDLPPLDLSEAWVARLRARLPELPEARRARFVEQLGLSAYDAGVLVASRAVAEYFEAAVALGAHPKAVANWMVNDLFGLLNAAGLGTDEAGIWASQVTPAALAELIRLVEQGAISSRAAKEVFEEMFRTGRSAAAIVEERGLAQISDAAALAQAVDEALAANPRVVADYQAGRRQALGFLVGQVLRATRGKANPGMVNRLLVEKLEARR